MKRVNLTVVFLVATALVLVSLFMPGLVGGALLLLIAAAAAVLLVGAWPRLSPVGRAARLAVLGLLLLLAIDRFT